MTSSSVFRLPLLLGVAACAIAAAPKADAQAYLDMRAQGSGACRAALPSFEGLVRYRPLALQNEGSSTAFVTCAIPQFDNPLLNDPTMGLWMYFLNASDVAATVRCTGVSFVDGSLTYIPLSVDVPAGTSATSREAALTWDEIDENGSGSYTTVSCGLPPGTGISTLYSYAQPVVVPDATSEP